MKKLSLLVLLLIVTVITVAGKTSWVKEKNARDEQELTALVHELASALDRFDSEALKRLYTNDYMEVNLQGDVDTKERVLQMYEKMKPAANSSASPSDVEIDQMQIRHYQNMAIVTARFAFKNTADAQNIRRPLRFTFVCRKEQGQWRVAVTHYSSTRWTTAKNLSTFEVMPVPEHVKSFNWTKLMEDSAGDGWQKLTADGKAFYFYF